MMNQKEGEFQELPQDIFRKAEAEMRKSPFDGGRMSEILAAAPLPTLYVDEKVVIKGVEFKVLAIMPNGELRLIMERRP